MPTLSKKILDLVGTVVSVAMVMFQVWYIYRPSISPDEGANIHLAFGLFLVFWYALRRAGRWYDLAFLTVCLVVSLFVTGYMAVNYYTLLDRIGIASDLDLAVGALTIVVVLEATRRAFGWAIPGFAILMLLYAYFGPYMPGLLHHGGFSLTRLVASMTTYLTGVYSSILGMSATIVAIFMIFGGFLNASYASNFFVKLALRLTRNTRAGSAFASVGASALFGSINGSPVANATTTGIFTIPLMKRHGFSGPFAAATEAVASTGGTLMPPIMGVAAFLMASITGIPYIQIAAHAMVPSIVFFGAVAIAIFVYSRKHDLMPMKTRIAADPRSTMWIEGVTFFVPFALIITLMISRYPITSAALLGTVMLIALVVLREGVYRFLSFRPPLELIPGALETAQAEGADLPLRDGLGRQLLNGCIEGAHNAARIAVVCGTLGIVVHAFTMTGMAGRLVHNMSDVAGGNLLLTLVIVAGVSLLFGLGVPTVGSYVIVAVLGAPLLTELGVELLAAHMFILYFTMLSGLTPPVGATVLVTSQIAGAGYWKSAVACITIATPGFVIPFLYAYEPALLGFGDITTIIWKVTAVLGGVYAFTVAMQNFSFTRCRPVERIVMCIAAVLLFSTVLFGIWLAAVGALAVGAVLLMQRQRLRLVKSNPAF
ncbi:DctM-like transporters [Marinovum algicola]|uniref:TRAP transporter, 4TM/12TM fusion protein n=1 Tax=Marinovum algicola TaxID=42444 RepID=A0A975WEV6_9RHOB|nr:TRAP transporter fused permease subunit [Marinovum algicola]SEK09100.1 TRAP transporter, 4TM/12TM fusion protein [Marinovum algicola]SLN71653.1 DctM-like transporters [Marinovum algicola]